MDPRERTNDMTEALRSAVSAGTADFWTALPVVVLEDSDGHLVKVRSTIKGWLQESGSVKAVEIPEFGMVPIHYPAGAGFTFTHPIKKGDEGIVVFASRCIDGWWKEGGIQAEPYRRQNSLSDAMYVPGIRNKPRKLNPYVSKETAQLRTDDQHLYVEIAKDKVKLVFATDKKDEGASQHDAEGGNGGNGQGGGQNGDKEEKEKKTQPRMLVEVYEDKIRGYVLDEQGQETSFFEHTKDGAFNGKAPQGVTWDAPYIRCTGEIIGKYNDNNIHLTTHQHSQPNDSRGDSERDTRAPTRGS